MIKIPIIEEVSGNGYKISNFINTEFKKDFIFDEKQIILDREEKAYNKLQIKLRKDLQEFEQEIYKEFPEEIVQFKKNRIDDLEEKIGRLTDEYSQIVSLKMPKIIRSWFISQTRLKEMILEVKKCESDIRKIQITDSIHKGKLTQQEIDRAKEYPFENLIELHKGKALCPFHEEKTPSFSINKKENYGHCFGCGKGVDTIQFVMETRNMDFVQAVKFLQ